MLITFYASIIKIINGDQVKTRNYRMDRVMSTSLGARNMNALALSSVAMATQIVQIIQMN